MNSPTYKALQHFFEDKERVAIAVDVSGSIPPACFDEFLRLCEKAGAKPPGYKIVLFDDRVLDVFPFRKEFEMRGGMGTNFQCVVETVETMGDCEGIVLFTDGFAPVPEKFPAPVLWVLIDGEPDDLAFPGERVIFYLPESATCG